MLTAVMLAASAVFFYSLAAASSRFSEPYDTRTSILSKARTKFNDGEDLTEAEASTLLEDEILEERNNRFRHF